MTHQVFLGGKVELYGGDSRDIIKTIPDNSISACICDPPYALVSITKRFGAEGAAPTKDGDVYSRSSSGFMGKNWDTGETAFAVEFWAEIMRVLKPGGHVVAFSGTRTYHRLAVAIEDAGFEIRDQLAWVYGSGFPKSHDVSKGIDKAAGAVREVVGKSKRHGGGVKGAGTSYEVDPAVPDITAPATDAARQWQGWGTALKPSWEPIVLARKPLAGTVAANVLEHGTGALNIDATRIGDSGGPATVAGDRHNTTVHAYGDGLGAQGGSIAQLDKGRWPANVLHDGSDEVADRFPDGESRFFYSAKADKQDRIGSKHPTVKPVDLMQWLCRLVTPPGGTVLDPFAGSGTTGEAAWREGFQCVLIEREPEYQADIAERLRLADKGPLERRQRAIKQTADIGPLFGANDNAPPPTEASDRANRAQALAAGCLNTTAANQNSSSETTIDAA